MSKESDRLQSAAGALAHDDLLMEVARSHYFHGLSKVEIATELGLSRFKIARLLDEALERGAVRVTLHRPRERWTGLAMRLKERFSLQHAVVVNAGSGNPVHIRQALGREGALLLQQHLSHEDVLGVGWGRTVKATADYVTSLPKCTVVQLGGIAGNPGENLMDLVRIFSGITGSEAYPLYTPLVVPSIETAESLKQAPEISATIDRFRDVSVAIASVGSWNPPNSQLRMFCSPEVREDLDRRGVQAEICGVLLDSEGNEIETALKGRIISATSSDLRRIPTVIAIAGHPSKAAALRAVLKGGYANMLVTDTQVARLLLTDDAK
ncbi:sugar-binding transcriptional regulator [Demequina flava]|uniref:sugar-binding transcriptional regulator n=1 Tax=Demequina flava TaxID=1095025 RepID=UPI000785E32F|nr:sugar-binding domain-containing protein [Demequina flava]